MSSFTPQPMIRNWIPNCTPQLTLLAALREVVPFFLLLLTAIVVFVCFRDRLLEAEFDLTVTLQWRTVADKGVL